MAFEGQSAGCAHPRAQPDEVTWQRGRLVVDLMPQHDPLNLRLRFRGRDGAPMRRGRILHPPQVDGVVHMSQFIDVLRHHRNCEFENFPGRGYVHGRAFIIDN